ncbi:MAG: hypothetical protein J6R47_02505 [Acholeplasmatales bacterium]|nr:hypothetical protein [Acholeplasmatales bacterium]
MQLKINKEAFFDVDKISILKSHVDKISKNAFNGTNLNGVIDINISYIDTSNDECFKALTLDFDIEIENVKVNDIRLTQTKIYVVESHGISVEYELELDYEALDEQTIEVIDDRPIEDNADMVTLNEIEKIKEDIHDDYENKLLDSLNSRELPNVAIIKTIDDRSEASFLSFFASKEQEFYSLKTLYCPNEEVLNDISKKYNVSINDLLKGYDRVSQRVTFKYNE